MVFHHASGNTHVINPIAGRVLHALADQSAGPLELTERIAVEGQVENDDELRRSVETLLANLDQLGLIEPVSR